MKKAVIASGGKQFLVAEGQELEVERVSADKALKFEPLMVIDGENISVGSPYVEGSAVSAKVIEEVKADKVTAIRYKSKKRVHKTRGHRQIHSLIKIEKIN